MLGSWLSTGSNVRFGNRRSRPVHFAARDIAEGESIGVYMKEVLERIRRKDLRLWSIAGNLTKVLFQPRSSDRLYKHSNGMRHAA